MHVPSLTEETEAEFYLPAAVPIMVVIRTSHPAESGLELWPQGLSRLVGQGGRNEGKCASRPPCIPFLPE